MLPPPLLPPSPPLTPPRRRGVNDFYLLIFASGSLASIFALCFCCGCLTFSRRCRPRRRAIKRAVWDMSGAMTGRRPQVMPSVRKALLRHEFMALGGGKGDGDVSSPIGVVALPAFGEAASKGIFARLSSAAVNAIEKVSGLDIDGDGDVGEDGSPEEKEEEVDETRTGTSEQRRAAKRRLARARIAARDCCSSPIRGGYSSSRRTATLSRALTARAEERRRPHGHGRRRSRSRRSISARTFT